MKIVMRKDVEKVGEAGSVQNVSDGYARNYLIPKGFAVVATEGELKMAAHNQAVKDRKILRQEQQLQSLADKIQGQSIVFEMRAGEGGRLFGSIGAADIATQLSEKIGEQIDRRRVELSEPIRSLGYQTVAVHLVGKLRPTVTVTVNPEAGTESEESDASEPAQSEDVSNEPADS